MSYDHQSAAIERIGRFLKATPARALIVAPPGTGKGNLLADAARMNDGRSLVMVHRKDLVTQLADRIRAFAPELSVGIEMGSGRADRSADVIVASVQTIGNARSLRLGELDFSLVLTDEAHRASAASYRRSVARLAPNAHHLGFTATPESGNGVPLMGKPESPFDSILWEMTILEAVESGALADLRGWVVKTQTKLDTVRIVDGDFNQSDLSEVVDTEIRTAACFKAWLDLAPDRRTLAFCASVAHAQNVAAFWKSQGVSAAAVWGDMPPKDREETLQRFRDGRTRVLTNCSLLTEGVDYPAIDCVLMMRPTRSKTLFVQSIGRGMRLHPGKDHCVVIDVVDATKRNDLLTLSSFSGLPSKINLQGETFLNAFRESEKLEIPESLRSGEMTLDELRMRVTEVRLLKSSGVARVTLPAGPKILRCAVCEREVRVYPYREKEGWAYCSRTCQATASRKDLTGMTFVKLKVLIDEQNGPSRKALCRCECGVEKRVSVGALRSGETISCGCIKGVSRRINLAGQRFGRLIALERVERIEHSEWLCQCDCGRTHRANTNNLRRGLTRSCGCLRNELAKERYGIDLIGRRFGSLTVEQEVPKKNHSGARQWRCKCDCGNYRDVAGNKLTGGQAKQCLRHRSSAETDPSGRA